MSYRGKYRPVNPKKYRGDPTKIVWRSTYELKMFKYCDLSSGILKWSSEEIVVPYVNPLDNKIHRYFVDIYIKYKTNSKEIKESIIEIKPKKDTIAPKRQSRKTKRYLHECETWVINNAKWKAATKWAEKRGMIFRIFTEKELGIYT